MIDFLDIVGQENALAQLQQAAASSRMPHAFLFVGPAGVGRRTTATALAKILLCENPQHRRNAGAIKGLEADFQLRLACGKCAGCKMMDADSHVDFQAIYKELARYHDDADVRSRVMQDLGIDVIRSFLIAPAYRSSARGRGKVFLVLEAELMSHEAQNALLKTLEEPPDGVTIILICTQAGELLPTTLSRCRHVHFRPLSRKFVKDRLVAAGIESLEAEFWAGFTQGSLGEALKMSKAGMYEIKRDIIERLGGNGGEADLAEYLSKLADDLAGKALAQAKQSSGVEMSKLLASRQVSGKMIELIAGAFRDALTLTSRAGRGLVNADQGPAIKALASRLTAMQIAGIIERLGEYEQLFWRNVNQKLIWDNLAVAFSATAARL